MVIWFILYFICGYFWLQFYWPKIQELVPEQHMRLLAIAVNFTFWILALPAWLVARFILKRDTLF